ncbi:hypothetical protein GCM10027294_00100 [Marinactinospora endophytica]
MVGRHTVGSTVGQWRIERAGRVVFPESLRFGHPDVTPISSRRYPPPAAPGAFSTALTLDKSVPCTAQHIPRSGITAPSQNAAMCRIAMRQRIRAAPQPHFDLVILPHTRQQRPPGGLGDTSGDGSGEMPDTTPL